MAKQLTRVKLRFCYFEAQQHKKLPLIECVRKQMYQECSMRVTKVADSPMFCDRTENTSLFMKKFCKQEYSKETLSWYNFNLKGIIIIPYDDKQIILLTSMTNNNTEL